MPLVRELAGRGDDGRPVYNYRQEPLDPSKPVLYTGPIKGDIVLAAGARYNVSDDFVECASHAHAGELSHHIGIRHEQDGHPSHKPRNHTGSVDDPEPYHPLRDEFHHVCSPACGDVARTHEQHVAEFNARLEALGHGDHVGSDDHATVVARLGAAYDRHNPQED
jgi:hypothetical protein